MATEVGEGHVSIKKARPIIGQVPIDVRVRLEARAPGGEYHEIGNAATQVQIPLRAAEEQPDERALHMHADASPPTSLLDPVVDALDNLNTEPRGRPTPQGHYNP